MAKLSATSVSFGNQKVGTTSAAKTVTLTNTGGGTLTIGSLTAGGSQPGRLHPQRDVRGDHRADCGSELHGGAHVQADRGEQPVGDADGGDERGSAAVRLSGPGRAQVEPRAAESSGPVEETPRPAVA